MLTSWSAEKFDDGWTESTATGRRHMQFKTFGTSGPSVSWLPSGEKSYIHPLPDESFAMRKP